MDHQGEYKNKLTTSYKAVNLIQSGNNVVIGMAVSQPPALLKALADKAKKRRIKNVRVYYYHSTTHTEETVLQVELLNQIRPYCFILGEAERKLLRIGREEGRQLVNYVPTHFSEVPRILRESIGVDVFIATVSLMDQNGYFSFGTNNDYGTTAAKIAKYVILEVNKNMPYVFGQSLIHIKDVDFVVRNDVPLVEVQSQSCLSTADRKIGQQVAQMIPDGANIQIGLGSTAEKVCHYLADKNDLGIHTELLTSGMVDLVRRGIATGKRKSINRNKAVFTLAIGDRKLYEFLDKNIDFESYPVDYVNSPSIISQLENFVSINTILQIDLLGQVNAEFLCGLQFSGTGGQVDYIRGSYLSSSGKSILAFNSTTADTKYSRIIPKLDGPVTDLRTDVHLIVTEYGTFNLKGKSVRERAYGIIQLAHPHFREELTSIAKQLNLV